MSLVSDRCICLRKTEFSETSQVLVLLGREHGLFHVIAKGAHRTTKAGASRFGGGIDLLDLGDAVFSDRAEKELLTLTEWKLTEGHLALRKNLRAMWLAMAAGELTGVLFEQRDAQPGIFDWIASRLEELSTNRREQAFLAYLMMTLREAGFFPELDHCAQCGAAVDARGAVSVDAGAGGVICRSCEGAFGHRGVLDGRLLGIARYVGRLIGQGNHWRKLPQLTRAQTDPINRVLLSHVENVLSKRLTMTRWVMGT